LILNYIGPMSVSLALCDRWLQTLQ